MLDQHTPAWWLLVCGSSKQQQIPIRILDDEFFGVLRVFRGLLRTRWNIVSHLSEETDGSSFVVCSLACEGYHCSKVSVLAVLLLPAAARVFHLSLGPLTYVNVASAVFLHTVPSIGITTSGNRNCVRPLAFFLRVIGARAMARLTFIVIGIVSFG